MRQQRAQVGGNRSNLSASTQRGGKSRDRGASQPVDYDHVRLLYRGYDHGVTAIAETADQKQARAEQCKTTGWQSKFAVPYRPLGTPELNLQRRQDDDDNTKAGDEKGETGKEGRGGLSARELKLLSSGITPSGRPLDWLPDARRHMVQFGEAVKRNQKAHRSLLLASVQASETRVRCVRAGRMASEVLDELTPRKPAQPGGDRASAVFMTSVPDGEADEGVHPLERQRALRRSRPNHVPPLRLGTTGFRDKEKEKEKEREMEAATRPVTTRTARTGAPTRGEGGASGAATARAGQGGEGEGGVSGRQLQARAEAIAGSIALLHPVPPLKLVAEKFREDVDGLTSRLAAELSAKDTERLDTFRRKYKNLELGDMGSSAEAQLQAMRISAEQEKLQNEIYLYQNRKWYLQLMNKVADPHSEVQQDLLKGIREMVEGGVVFSKSTVRELVSICTEKTKKDHFTSKAIQDVFDFLCKQFDVQGEEYDGWLQDNQLPLPPSTQARYEAGRQKRLALFKRDLVAKHWRQRFEMMSTTKDLHEWLSEDVVDAVLDSVRARGGPSPTASASRASSLSRSASQASKEQRPESTGDPDESHRNDEADGKHLDDSVEEAGEGRRDAPSAEPDDDIPPPPDADGTSIQPHPGFEPAPQGGRQLEAAPPRNPT